MMLRLRAVRRGVRRGEQGRRQWRDRKCSAYALARFVAANAGAARTVQTPSARSARHNNGAANAGAPLRRWRQRSRSISMVASTARRSVALAVHLFQKCRTIPMRKPLMPFQVCARSGIRRALPGSCGSWPAIACNTITPDGARNRPDMVAAHRERDHAGSADSRPNVGFLSPTVPHRNDGLRIEPPVSVPIAIAANPPATAAAEPLLDPLV